MGIEKIAAAAVKMKGAKNFAAGLKTVKSKSLFKTSLPQKKVNMRQKVSSKELAQETKILTDMQNDVFSSALTENFAVKKQRLIEELSKVCDKNTLARIEQVQTPEQMAKILVEQDIGSVVKVAGAMLEHNIASVKAGKQVVRKFLPLEFEKMAYAKKMERGKLILAREKAMHVPSTNPQVIAIENILKEQYGMKFVSLKDNEVLAKQILKACETASKNGIKLPKNISVSDFMFADGENLFNGTILLNAKQSSLQKGFCSTDSDFHVVLHEIMHGEHPKLLSFSMKKIPQRFQEIKENLSIYSKYSGTHETFTELNTKRLIDGLNPKEQELYNYLNIFG